jgi:hypothetical protein
MKALFMGLLITGAAAADVVTDWNEIMRTNVSPTAPPEQARYAAITHLAMFEAVNAITKEYTPYLGTVTARRGANPEAAAIAAAHRMLINYFPANAATLDARRAQSLGQIPDSASKTAGIAVGEAAAKAMIAARANDGSGDLMDYTPKNGIGFWQPTPPNFPEGQFLHWGKVTPVGLASGRQFRPKPPPALTSCRYARDYNEVKSVGALSSTTRTPEETNLALWASMTSPVNLWNPVAVEIVTRQRKSLSQNARIFALLNMAIFDASIATFEAKYFYHLWRPVTAIHAGDLDGNSRTKADPGFMSLLTAPPYPAYPSGHGGLSNGGRVMLQRLLGTRHSITLTNPGVPGLVLKYSRLRQVTDDIADARIFAGIHFRFDQVGAEILGRQVARYIHLNYLRCARADGCGCEAEDEAEIEAEDGEDSLCGAP